VTPARLRKLRAELHLQRRFRVGQLEDLAAAVAEPPSSTDEAERQVAHALAVAAESALSDIDDALQRFHSGGYGKCEHCAARIPFERLEALPMARFCMPCQYRKETSRLPQRTWGSAQWPSS
jgi:RNA polymerase-binding transcription factor DksA